MHAAARARRGCQAGRLRAAIALGWLAAAAPAARGQLSSGSFWPKFQRDLQNTGYVPLVGIAADAHVAWYVRLGPPVSGENHATPVLSPDNSRLYVGGQGSRFTCVDLQTGTVAWSIQLGDGSGIIHQTAAVGADGCIYVGAWDNVAPYDGFCKLQDEGDHAQLVWTFPMRRLLASPTITPAGLVVVGGQHANGVWGYYALRDLGESHELVWSAAHQAQPGNPASTGAIGSSPALLPDGAQLFGGSYENRTFWQINAVDGSELARLTLDYYCYASSPLAIGAGYTFIGEGMSFTNPDDQNQGKLYAFAADEQGLAVRLDSLALQAGHLNGGVGACRVLPDGPVRIYVPANGYGKPQAALVAVDFDPQGGCPAVPQGCLSLAWRVPLGPGAMAYPQAVVTRDAVVYVIGPADHQLYAIRDTGDRGQTLWSLSLGAITRAAGWSPGSQRGPQGVCVGPDGTLYWNAPDGYLYAVRGWLTGDLDGDGELGQSDLDLLVLAATDPAGYELRFPEIDALAVGDLNGDGRLDAYDVGRLAELLGP